MRYALILIGYVILALTQITGIGYFLYEWGAQGLPIGVSAWNAFILWSKMLGSGLLMILLGFVLPDITFRKKR